MNFQAVQIPTQAAQQVQWNWQEVSSNSDIFSLTSLDASASANYGLFSASAEMSLLSQNQVSNYNVNVLAQVNVEQKWDIAGNAALKDDVNQVLQQNQEQFMARCGNRYVAGVLYGGAFYGLLSVNTSSQSDKEKVTASMRASYGTFGSGQGSISQETLQTLSTHQTTIKGYATGSGATAIPMYLDQMRSRFANYPAEVTASGGAPVRVLLVEYPPVAAPANPVIYELASLRWDYVSAKREVRFVLDNPAQFYVDLNSWRQRLQGLEAEAQSAITRIDAAITGCQQQTASACARPAGLKAPSDIRASLPPRYVGDCGKRTLKLSSFSMDVHPLGGRCGGDTEVGGHNPSIDITASLDPQANGKIVNVRSHVRIKEGKKDWTCFEQSRTSTFMNLDLEYPGCYLRAKEDAIPGSGSLSARGGNDNHSWTQYGGGSQLVESANCLSDTKGKDAGKLGCRNIRFRDANVSLRHDEDKMALNQLIQNAARTWANKAEVFSDLRKYSATRTQQLNALQEQIKQRTGSSLDVQKTAPPDVERPVLPKFRQEAPGRFVTP